MYICSCRWISTLLLLLIFASCSSTNVDWSKEIVVQSEQEISFQKASLKVYDGVSFLSVSGSPYEAGMQYGVLLKDRLHKLSAQVEKELDKYIGTFFVKRWMGQMVLSLKIRNLKKRMPKDYLDEMKGMAEGAQIDLKKIELVAFFPQLFFDLNCTSFVARNKKQIIHGRNLDWGGIDFIADYPLVVEYNITGKKSVTNITYIGYPALYSGMNIDGISLAVNRDRSPSHNGESYDDDIPLPYKTRQILESVSSLKEVEAQLGSYKSHGWFLTFASRKDHQAAIYELGRGEVIKNRLENDFIHIENVAISHIGRTQNSPIWVHNESNRARGVKVGQLAKAYSKLSLLEKSYKILSDHSYYEYPHNPFYRYSINNSTTVQSMIFDLSGDQIIFSFAPAYAGANRFLKYDTKNKSVELYRPKQRFFDNPHLAQQKKFRRWASKMKDQWSEIIKRIEQWEMHDNFEDYFLAKSYRELGKFPKALRHADQLLGSYPDSVAGLREKYLIYKQMEQWDQAAIVLQKMIKLPNISQVELYKSYLQLTEVYQMKKQWKRALKAALKAAKLLESYYLDQRALDDLEKLNEKVEKFSKLAKMQDSE